MIATRRSKMELKKLQSLSDSLTLTTDNREAVEQAAVIILATKETSFEDIAKEIKDVRKGKLLISLGPTCTLEKLEGLFGGRNIRLITPVNPTADLICYATDAHVQSEDEEMVRAIFGGNTLKIPEAEMPIATAYTLFRGIMNSFFEPLCETGMRAGLPEELARKMMGDLLTATGEEMKRGVSAKERLGNASGGFNEQSFTMRLWHNLEPSRKGLQELFEKACQDFKK